MDILSDKIVTTRKDHVCDACFRKFPKGSKMKVQVNTYGGGLNVWRECYTCMKLIEKFREKFADEYNICESCCVHNRLEENETPEMMLERFLIEKANNHG